MRKVDALENLKKFELSTIYKINHILNIKGIILDEEIRELSSNMIEKWNHSCEKYLKENGYIGGSILTHGKYFESYGAVYSLYNSNCHDNESAEVYMNEYIRNFAN